MTSNTGEFDKVILQFLKISGLIRQTKRYPTCPMDMRNIEMMI